MGYAGTVLSTKSSRALRAGAERGDRREHRTLRAARRINAWWFLEAWRTKHGSKLDRLGWDIVIETVDVGRIILQVKGTAEKAAEFVAHGKTLDLVAPIHTLTVDDSTDDATLFGMVLGTCIKAREEAMAAGVTADDPRLCRRAA